MRYQALTVGVLLALSMNAAYPASADQMLREQRLRIDNAISARNELLDRIHFAGHNSDSIQLASINASELTVEYALQALEAVLTLDGHRSVKEGGLKSVGEPMLMVCQAQVGQMESDSALLADSRVRGEVEKQIGNVRAACGAIVAATS